MPPLTALFLNDFDTSSLGLAVENVDGWNSSPSARDRVTQLPGRVGSIILAPEAETASRTLRLSGVIRSTSVKAVRAAIDELKHRLFAGTIEVRFADDPEKVFYARCEEKQLVVTPPQFINPYSRVSIGLFCPDPLIYDRLASAIAFTPSVRAPVPLGTAVSAPLIRIMGPVSGLSVTYRDKSGTARQTMSFSSLAMLGTDYLEIDCELFAISLYQSGVKSNAISQLISGDFIAVDPQDGDYASGAWPTLECSQGTGEVLYRRAWL